MKAKDITNKIHVKYLSKAKTAIIDGTELTVLPYGYLTEACDEVIKEAVKQALELAAERAEVKPMKMGQYHGTDKYGYFVEKQSILSIIDEIE